MSGRYRPVRLGDATDDRPFGIWDDERRVLVAHYETPALCDRVLTMMTGPAYGAARTIQEQARLRLAETRAARRRGQTS